MAKDVQHNPTTKRLNLEALRDQPQVALVTSLGESIKIVSDDTAKFNSDAAYRHLELQAFENERSINANWVAYLIKTVRQDTFRPETVVIASATCDEMGPEEIRINGQHTAWTVIETGVVFSFRKIKYRCATKYDLRQLYASYDRGKARSGRHIAMSYLGGAEEFRDLQSRAIHALVSGLGLYLWPKNEMNKHDADERSYLLLSEHHDVGVKISNFMRAHFGRDERMFFRSAVVSAMFYTFKKAAGASDEFWGRVVSGVGADSKGDPALRLRNYLLRIAGRLGTTNEKIAATDEIILRACLLAWNAYREDRTLESLKPGSTTDRPKVK